MNRFLNIAGYKFILLSDIENLRKNFHEKCEKHVLKGTIILSEEGININLAGFADNINSFIVTLKQDVRFNDLSFRESYSEIQPFKRLKIKIKKEIITLRQSQINPTQKRAPLISPEILKQWLDEKRNFTLLDTRNTFEFELGTFQNAQHLALNHFSELPSFINKITNDKPIVTFCTGGIRCEKAALYLMNHGFNEVYQLEGGILNYFNKIGGAHYKGDCFVFDDRNVVKPTNIPSQ